MEEGVGGSDGAVAVVAGFDPGLAKFLPFQDLEACAKVRRITRGEMGVHANRDFRISMIDSPEDFYGAMAGDVVSRVRSARDEGRDLVLMLPCGPVRQYRIAAELLNRERLGLDHVHTFNMDEYADGEGQSAPASWRGSFQYKMQTEFFGRLEEGLRPPESHVHFPSSRNATGYSDEIASLGGAEVCYGGVGWDGHIAFWEPQLAWEFEGDWEGWLGAGTRVVELHPITIMQDALLSFGGDWSAVPPKAVTVGPRDIVGAGLRSFWLDGDLGRHVSWQRFIALPRCSWPSDTACAGFGAPDASDGLRSSGKCGRRCGCASWWVIGSGSGTGVQA